MPQIGEIKTAKKLEKKQLQERRQYIWVACLDCGKERWVSKDYWDKGGSRYCRSCYCLNHRGFNWDKHPMWKGGRRIENGYVCLKVKPDNPLYSMSKNGYIREHRLMIAQTLGRVLNTDEIVHHIDGIREDNRLENLVLTKRGKHEHHTLLKVAQKRIRDLEQAVKVVA